MAIAVGVGLVSAVRFLEEKAEAGAMVPFLLQLILLNAFNVFDSPNNPVTYTFLSIAASVVGYGALISDNTKANFMTYLGKASLVTAYFTPFTALFYANDINVIHPISLVIAGLLSLHYAFRLTQENREAAGGIVLLGVYWLMYYAGVRNIQAYSHILALFFVGYAYWRHHRSDEETSRTYVVAALLAATVPLIAQAVSSDAGQLYGVWLLAEMVLIMLVGIALRNRLATMWGLYVAVGAVLYQLRELGWAMLAVLAVFIIGIAIYRANHQDGQ